MSRNSSCGHESALAKRRRVGAHQAAMHRRSPSGGESALISDESVLIKRREVGAHRAFGNRQSSRDYASTRIKRQ
eukprot:15476744-Alexandrium_andersonii.AAC.1